MTTWFHRLRIFPSNRVNDNIQIYLPRYDTQKLELNGMKIDTQEASLEAIDKTDNALKMISALRAMIGGQQNRLEASVKIGKNTSENTEASDSRIRDTDIAEEMLKYTKASILEDAGQAMLAQTFSLKRESILSILQ